MSRSFDVLLLGLVGGLGWWLFAREDGPVDEPASAPPALVGAAPEAPPSSPDVPTAEAGPPAPRAVTFGVDDPAVLAHPSFRLVVAEATTGRLAPVTWQRDADGRVVTEVAPGRSAVGLALVHPTLEVLAWIPLDPSSGSPAELPVRLSERFARIALDVRDPSGQVVHDTRLSLCSAEPARTLDGARAGLPVDADGKVLVPRRAGVCVEVWNAHGTATVVDPVDGATVQLTAR